MQYLPNEEWKYRQSINSNFNNQLLSAYNQGFSLYDRETDTKLYRETDYKPLDRLNFDDINDKLKSNYSKNDDVYNNSKSFVYGFVDQINNSTKNTTDNAKKEISKATDAIKHEIKNLFNIDTSNLKIYGGLLILFIILNR